MSASSAGRPAASSHQQTFPIFLSRNATGFDQDDAAGLDAERAFDYHLLEQRMLLEAADAYRRMLPPGSIRAARLSQRLETAEHLLKRSSLPSLCLRCLLLSGAQLRPKGRSAPRLP